MKMNWARKQLQDSKRVLRLSIREATTEKLRDMLAAARSEQMPFSDYRRCFASRLYGSEQMRKTVLEDGSPFRIAERAYNRLDAPIQGESVRQRRAVAIIKAELRIRSHHWIDHSRARAYFAAAENQAWFLLSLSRKATIAAAFVESQQELLGACK